MHKIKGIYSRSLYIFRNEGILSLLRLAITFVIRGLFEHEHYYVYEHDIRKVYQFPETEWTPRIDHLNFHIVSTNEQADELVEKGYDDFRQYSINGKYKLDRGAIAFCTYIKHELASIGWAALTEEAKKTIDNLPYRVNFSNKESCTGSSMTNPKCRQMGLMVHNLFKRWIYLRDLGIVTDRATVAKSNYISRKGSEKLAPKITEARYVRILCWRYWKESPLV